MGLRVAASVLLGSILCWVVLVPQMHRMGVIETLDYRTMVSWSLWPGAACMVTSGLLAFALQWKAVARALSGLTALVRPRAERTRNSDADAMDAIEVPPSWFAAGTVIGTLGVVWIAYLAFAMPVWMGLLAVILSFFLALVACRVTGETDTTPVGAMGKVTQLMYGAITPHSMRVNAPMQTKTVNLMAAGITAGIADSASDLLIDLKSGYILGANPRKQFIAQFAGIFMGTLVTVFAFNILVPNASVLGSDRFPAPAAQTWRGVAEAMALGLSNMHPVKLWAIVIGGLVGIVLPVLSKLFPKRAKWLPSPAGLGLAWTFHWYYGALFFLGALVADIWQKRRAKQAEEFLFPIASGIIAGGALMGVVLIFWENGPDMLKILLKRQ